ncbi:hypothetical protein E1262_16085 [Jiangella aurantiaca]|uniref:PQQ-like beta-propeller repeat protein n=1 Tax=Jiangella aurantiaca TaxID=2530373 RepID=A0A4R5A9M5_9ACTN|nr:PQQ-binding-like beta-propeller repeat protein [Jiangella aurantiaca]TDD68325.1 hypothetical protein E1262_16085 [Jiangella aurantiaca]
MRALLSGSAVLVLALATAAAAPPAGASGDATDAPPPGEVTSLGTPLQDVLLIGGTLAPGPDGTPVLWGASSGAPAHLNAVDPATGEAVARFDLPGAGGSWAVDAGQDGSVYVGTYGAPGLYRWTAAGGVEALGNPIAGETFVWDVSVADDGQVYGGTSPGGKLFGFDPATGAFRDFGRLSPIHAYVRSVAVHGDTIFAGTENPAAVFAVDRVTGASTALPLPDGLNVSTAWAYDVDVVGDYLYVRFGTASPSPLYVWDIAAGQWVDHIDTAHGLEPSPPDEEGRVYLIVAGELVRYDPRDGSMVGTDMPFTGRVANTRGIGWAELGLPDYPGRSIVGLLWRGMMFRYNPTTGARSFVQTTIEGEPIDITALSEGPDGRVYAGGFLNGGFAAVDPSTGVREEFHTFSQSEAMTQHAGRLYVGAYPDARVYSYDPALPWHSPEYSPSPEPGAVDNPRRLFDFKADRQIRPRALASAGDHLAVGTMPDLGELGGVFALYDAAGGQLVHAERDLIDDESIIALAYRDGVVYGATSIYGGQSATPPTQPEATVFAWSVAERRLLWELHPVPGKPSIPALAFDDAGRLWGLSGTDLFAVDLSAASVVERVSLGSSGSSSGDLVFSAVDGLLYASPAGARLVRVDPSTLAVEQLWTGSASHLAAHSDGDVYVASGDELLRFTPRCTTTITGTHRGDLTASTGTLCLDGATVLGSVTVTDGAGLRVGGGSVFGSVTADGASPVVIDGVTVRGAVTLVNGPAPAAVVSGSTIFGSLDCSGNAEPPTDDGVPNRVRGARTGQCATL